MHPTPNPQSSSNLEIRDRNGNWHPLKKAFFYESGKGQVLTYFLEDQETYYNQHHIDRFLEEGTVRETPSFDILKTRTAITGVAA